MRNDKLDYSDCDLAFSNCQDWLRGRLRRVAGVASRVVLMAAGLMALPGPAAAQMPPAPGTPNFWDLQRRVEKPNTAFLRVIRFITDDDYPPFGLTLRDRTLTGFNVDLARAICKELAVACTVQARRFDTIVAAIETGRADAAVASLAISPKARERLLFTHPYYRTPARFVSQRNTGPVQISPAGLAGKTIGVIAGTAHAAFLARFFPKAKPKTYRTTAALLAALKSRETGIIFGDGVTLAIWLNAAASGDCCEFRGGPYTESYFFGEGVGIAVHKNNRALKQALDFALFRLAEKGVYSELYLKHFPIGFY